MTDQQLLSIYTAERSEVQRRIEWANVICPKLERLKQRKNELDTLIDTLQRQGA